MSVATKCDFCEKFFEDEALKKDTTWGSKSIELNIEIKDQTSNAGYDACSGCLKAIILKISEEK